MLALILAISGAAAADEGAPESWPLGALEWLRGDPRSKPAAPIDGAALERALHAAANAERAAHGLPPLAPDARLAAVARAHSRDMAERGYFGHYDFERRGPGERLQHDYAEWIGAFAENVYHVGGADALTAPERTPEALARRIVRGWMASPGHRANLLRAEMSLGGLGAWTTARDLWITHLLGRPVAILAAALPTCVPVGRGWALELSLGPDLASPGAFDALLMWPDPTKRFLLPDGTYLEGAEPLPHRRTGARVRLTVPELRLLGTYRVRLGRDGRYFDLGGFQVETWCAAPP